MQEHNETKRRFSDRMIWIAPMSLAVGPVAAELLSKPVTLSMDRDSQSLVRRQVLAEQCLKDWVELGPQRTFARSLVRAHLRKKRTYRLGFWHEYGAGVKGEQEVSATLALFGRCGTFLSQGLLVRSQLSPEFLADARAWLGDLIALRARSHPSFDSESESRLEYAIAGLRDLTARRSNWIPVEFTAGDTQRISADSVMFCGVVVNRNDARCSVPALCLELESADAMSLGHWLFWSKHVQVGAFQQARVEGAVCAPAGTALKLPRFAARHADFDGACAFEYPARE